MDLPCTVGLPWVYSTGPRVAHVSPIILCSKPWVAHGSPVSLPWVLHETQKGLMLEQSAPMGLPKVYCAGHGSPKDLPQAFSTGPRGAPGSALDLPWYSRGSPMGLPWT